VIESEAVTLNVAARVASIADSLGIPAVFKASYDKANRTSVSSFRGPGIQEGLRILEKTRSETGLPIISDVHSVDQVRTAGKTLDMLQIPAFLCRQTDLLVAAGATGRAVNIKKGQFLSPDDMQHAIRKVESAGNSKIMLTERGTTFGYKDLVVDMRSIFRLREFGHPVVFDATHSAQSPGGGQGCSGGDRSVIPTLAMAAVAAGADGVFMETHPDPDHALCDGPNSWPLDHLESLMRRLLEVRRAVRRHHEEIVPHQRVESPRRSLDECCGDRLKSIRLIIFDVDGALTDGRIILGNAGIEIKAFDVRDGHGIKIAKRHGIEVAFVTGRKSEIVTARAAELGVSRVFQGVLDKAPVLETLLSELRMGPQEVAVLADDVVDIPLFRRVGASFTVPGAPNEVRREALFVTRNAAGRGAAREMVEMILKAQGKWDAALAKYYL
jgi:2-dehydro-3-deoxyphosphooctonate aldolase (KDO 8-P synthase)